DDPRDVAHPDTRESTTRKAAPDEAKHFLDLAMKGRSAEEMVHLAATVASPVESDAPVVDAALARAKQARKGAADMDAAKEIVAEFRTAARACATRRGASSWPCPTGAAWTRCSSAG